MRLWQLISWIVVFKLSTSVATKNRGTSLKEAFTYVVYLLNANDGSLVCLGVIFDDTTFATAAGCKVDVDNHVVKLSIIPETETECDIAIEDVKTFFLDGEVGISLVKLKQGANFHGCKGNSSIVGWAPMDSTEISNFGIVPTYGYPPRVFGLELVEQTLCEKLSTKIGLQVGISKYFCADEASQNVFVSTIGDVKMGLPCNTLGAPFISNGTGHVLGLMVYVDCIGDPPTAIFMAADRDELLVTFELLTSAKEEDFGQHLTQTMSSATTLAPLTVLCQLALVLQQMRQLVVENDVIQVFP